MILKTTIKQYIVVSKQSLENLPSLEALVFILCVCVCGNYDMQIKSLNYRIQHESIPLSEEKQILRDIKQLQGTREQVIANDATRAKIQDSLGEKVVIQDQVKVRQSSSFPCILFKIICPVTKQHQYIGVGYVYFLLPLSALSRAISFVVVTKCISFFTTDFHVSLGSPSPKHFHSDCCITSVGLCCFAFLDCNICFYFLNNLCCCRLWE